jgi:hypothetical protein
MRRKQQVNCTIDGVLHIAALLSTAAIAHGYDVFISKYLSAQIDR